MSPTFEFWLDLAWLGAKRKGKILQVIEIFFTFFNTALSQSSIVAQYPKKNMIKFSQHPEQQKIVFPTHDLNLEGYKIKSTLAFKIFSTLTKQVILRLKTSCNEVDRLAGRQQSVSQAKKSIGMRNGQWAGPSYAH